MQNAHCVRRWIKESEQYLAFVFCRSGTRLLCSIRVCEARPTLIVLLNPVVTRHVRSCMRGAALLLTPRHLVGSRVDMCSCALWSLAWCIWCRFRWQRAARKNASHSSSTICGRRAARARDAFVRFLDGGRAHAGRRGEKRGAGGGDKGFQDSKIYRSLMAHSALVFFCCRTAAEWNLLALLKSLEYVVRRCCFHAWRFVSCCFSGTLRNIFVGLFQYSYSRSSSAAPYQYLALRPHEEGCGAEPSSLHFPP